MELPIPFFNASYLMKEEDVKEAYKIFLKLYINC